MATPLLNDLIRVASEKWSSDGVSRFVFWVELALAAVVLIIAVAVFFCSRKKFGPFLLSIGLIFIASYIFFRIVPNPYELTHYPEYAVLSMLIFRAVDLKNGRKKLFGIGNPYLSAGLFTALVGMADEIFQYFLPDRSFIWYDILLNAVGGIIGLLLIWGLKKEPS